MESSPSITVSKRATLIVVVMTSFLNPFMSSSINVALPMIGREFSMSAVLLGWVATVYLLATSVLLVPIGKISDIYGRKKVFVYGMAVYTISSLLLGMSTSATMLLALRFLQGMGAAAFYATGSAILISVFPASERGRVLGIYAAGVYVGLSVGPFLGGLLTQQFGWRSIFLVNVPLGIAILIATLWKLRAEWIGAGEEKFDFRGSLIYGAAVMAMMYGFSTLPAVTGAAAIVAGILCTVVLIKWETKVESPVLCVDLFKNNRVFAFSNLAALISYSAVFAVSFLLSLYLQYIKGLSPQNAGLVLVLMPVIQAVLSPVAGRLSDRFEPRLLASLGMSLTTVGLLPFHFFDQATDIKYILTSLVVLGFGFSFFSSPNTNAVMSSVEKSSYGVASATLSTMRQFGMTFSIGIAMLSFSVFIGKVQITPEYYPAFITSMKIAFLIFAGLCFGGIFASLARGKVH